MTPTETDAVLATMSLQRNTALDDVCRQAAVIAALKAQWDDVEAVKTRLAELEVSADA